jgi:chromosomal replication initiator protein
MVTTVAKEDDCFVIYTANEYAADFLKSNYLQKFKNCLEFASGAKDLCIEFRFDRNAQPAIVVPQIKQKTPTVKQSRVSSFISTMPLNEEYTFDEFVRGPSNSFALAAAMGAANNPGKSMYNPLFIHGGSGLGKTHLMQAIGNELKKRDASLAICYLTAEEFLNEYVNYLAKKGLPDFRNKYRSIDVLLLDDVQFFQRGKDIQEEFFNTFNALQQQHKQIVMTSDVAPKDLPAIETRLITRFEGGIVQEIESPSYETRLAILRKKAEGMIPKVPDAVLEFIADNIKSHVRAMEGALGKVSIYLNSFPEIIPSNEILSHLLKDSIEKEKTIRKLTIEEIQNLVSNKYGVSMNQILSSERTQSIVTPRQLAMYIARKYTTKSLPEIAKKFDKTHATILHGVKSIEKGLMLRTISKLHWRKFSLNSAINSLIKWNDIIVKS